MESALYLIPVPLSETPVENVLPSENISILRQISHFIVENERSARRFLKSCDRQIDIDTLTFYTLNGHTPVEEISSYLDPLRAGSPMGVISEAGCPAVADPGADVVAIAQREGLRVIPLVGPCSIVMSLMASGMNGQNFAFLGYLPIDASERAHSFRSMERAISERGQTQIFIETPYRNDRILSEICERMPRQIRLCVATGITGEGERIVTKTVAEWATQRQPIGKVPTIFLLGSPQQATSTSRR